MVGLGCTISACIFACASICWGHPGHDHHREASERSEYLKHHARSFAHCAADLRFRSSEAAGIKRRQDLAEGIRQKRGLGSHPFYKADNLVSARSESHLSENSSIGLDTIPQDLFGDSSSCILQPEGTEGPYYVTGELIRRNITDGEKGVPLALDIQIVDTSTCEPVPAIYVDIWHCNATGVYSGVVADGNGISSDSGNLNNTAFRGLQKTDDDGIVQFDTIFPGHYLGRTNHIHILTHNENAVTVNDNGTLSGNVASHVGQIFFDQSLQAAVEANEPYTLNTQALTTNSRDVLFASEANISHSIMEHVLLGEHVTDGILAWIRIGIDPTERHTTSATVLSNVGSDQSVSGASRLRLLGRFGRLFL